MAQDAPTTIHLKDYKPAPYVPGDLFLNFSLEPQRDAGDFAPGVQRKSRRQGKKCGARSCWRKDQAHQREA